MCEGFEGEGEGTAFFRGCRDQRIGEHYLRCAMDTSQRASSRMPLVIATVKIGIIYDQSRYFLSKKVIYNFSSRRKPAFGTWIYITFIRNFETSGWTAIESVVEILIKSLWRYQRHATINYLYLTRLCIFFLRRGICIILIIRITYIFLNILKI